MHLALNTFIGIPMSRHATVPANGGREPRRSQQHYRTRQIWQQDPAASWGTSRLVPLIFLQEARKAMLCHTEHWGFFFCPHNKRSHWTTGSGADRGAWHLKLSIKSYWRCAGRPACTSAVSADDNKRLRSERWHRCWWSFQSRWILVNRPRSFM